VKAEIVSIHKKGEIFRSKRDIYLYLSWIDSKKLSGLAISSSPLSIPHIVESNLFDLLDFFASNFFIFHQNLFLTKPNLKSKGLVS
jgi:hypothetical protein